MSTSHTKTNTSYAFSLIEMLVTLIVVSLVMAALTPVITKKLKSNAVTVGQSSETQVEFEADCSKWEDCALCSEEKCSLCTKDCLDDEYTLTADCICAKCDTKHDNCEQCTASKCKKCYGGYGLTSINTCKLCEAGYYSDGSHACKVADTGHYVANAGSSTQTKCPIGQYQDEVGQISCKTCTSGTYQDLEGQSTCKTCEIDYACTGGNNKTQCALNEGATAGSSTCSACPTNCADCQIPGNCLKCEAGYYLSNKLCYACDSGYYCDGTATKNTCASKWENCTTCNDTGCITCADGYVLSEGKCESSGLNYQYTEGVVNETVLPDGTKLLKFTSTGTLYVLSAPAEKVTVFAVGGGGGGSPGCGRGGGGGYTYHSNAVTLEKTNYTITIGAGGSSGQNGIATTVKNNSTNATIVSAAGGKSGSTGGHGGSGGGGGGTWGQNAGKGGYNGGNGAVGYTKEGASVSGGTGQGTGTTIFRSVIYSNGGGGGCDSNSSCSAGSAGGSGAGAGARGATGGNGTNNTGGGGGGGGCSSATGYAGGRGGSGILFIISK